MRVCAQGWQQSTCVTNRWRLLQLVKASSSAVWTTSACCSASPAPLECAWLPTSRWVLLVVDHKGVMVWMDVSVNMCIRAEDHTVLHTSGGGSPDLWGWGYLHPGSDPAVSPHAASHPQQDRLLCTSYHRCVDPVQHHHQYPLLWWRQEAVQLWWCRTSWKIDIIIL